MSKGELFALQMRKLAQLVHQTRKVELLVPLKMGLENLYGRIHRM